MLEPLEHSTTTLDSNKRIEAREENDVKTYLPASQWRFLNLYSILIYKIVEIRSMIVNNEEDGGNYIVYFHFLTFCNNFTI